MYMFSRLVTLNGSPRKVLPWIANITKFVNDHGTLPTSCWQASFGYPLGTVAWSTVADSQVALSAAMGALLAQDGFHDLLDAGTELIAAPGQDTLRELVYGTPSEPPPIGAVATVTTATAAVDRLGDAFVWAVEVAQYVENVIGSPVAVLRDMFGTLGGITWVGSVPDAAAADAAAGKMAADSGYLAKVAGSKDLFIPGSGHSGQLVRIA
jgi:hypothetical protein